MVYLKYFFYIGVNWGWIIAIKLLLEEIKGENKYGISTTGTDELKSLSQKGIDISKATFYMPSSYSVLEKAFKELHRHPKKHLLDIGSGKGRCLCVGAYFGFKKLTGIDFSAELCKQATENLTNTNKRNNTFSFEIINASILDTTIPKDIDCVLLFNPFNEKMTQLMLEKMKQDLPFGFKDLTVIYINPLYKALFTKAGFKEIYYDKRFTYLEVSILKYPYKK
ncbi:MAG: methyltransferase domain-containing protein [Ferruginibacter sp.]